MKIFYDIRYESINNLSPLSIGLIDECDNYFYGEQICNILKSNRTENFVFCQNENEDKKNMNFAPGHVCFCSSTSDLSLNLRHWLSRFKSDPVEFATLSNDGYIQVALNLLLYAYKDSVYQQANLPFPDSLNILGINYNLSQDISRYLKIDRPATTKEINTLLSNLKMDPYRLHTDIYDNSLYLAYMYKELYGKII